MSEPAKSSLKVSREGVVLIKSFAGFRPRAVRGDDGRWVIGYGHTLSAREGLTVGEQDAELLLQYDLLPVVKALNERVSAGLNQHQFDALASFALSVGVERFLGSDVLQRLNDGQAEAAADALIGWPELTPPDQPLRRRAAERALFTADPASPVHLAQLLTVPVPGPATAPEAEAPVIQPVFNAPADARAAAVASLLGETATEEPPAADTPEPDPAPVPPPAPPTPPVVEPTAFAPPQSLAAIHLQRYSPYAAAIIGPLPGFPTAAPRQTTPEPAPVSEPPAVPAEVAAPAPSPVVAESAPPAPQTAPVSPLVPVTPGPSPFPPMDEPLVLTPATEADFVEVVRPVWPEEERVPAPAEDAVLFEEEPTAAVLRHETEATEPRRFDWSETGAFLIMGGVGLAACGASAAAFRLTAEQPSPMGETTLIAWVLAVIGAICVGVSSWNLYVRWGKAD